METTGDAPAQPKKEKRNVHEVPAAVKSTFKTAMTNGIEKIWKSTFKRCESAAGTYRGKRFVSSSPKRKSHCNSHGYPTRRLETRSNGY